MSDLRDLYQELILEHSRSPRNFREIPGARRKEGFNPLCGDRFTVFVDLDGDAVKDAAFRGEGCAISTASASIMTEAIKGLPLGEVQALYSRFHDLVTGKDAGDPEEMGKLAVFAGVSDYPARVKCASLAWHALDAAMKGGEGAVSTE